MYITDPSITSDGEGLTAEQERLMEGVEVLIFSLDLHLFPRVARPGDFIRFHRVMVNSVLLYLRLCFVMTLPMTGHAKLGPSYLLNFSPSQM